MNKGIKLRIIVHNILFDILKLNINFEYALDKNISSISDKRDIAFINNVCLNSMRYSIHSKKILKLYSKIAKYY